MRRGISVILFGMTVAFLAPPARAGAWSATLIFVPCPPSARELAARASRAQVDVAFKHFIAAHTWVMREHPLSIEIELARQTLLKAQCELALFQADLRAELRKTNVYHNLSAADKALGDKIAAEKEPAARLKLATERLAVRKKIVTIEQQALATDYRVSTARVAASEARQKVLRLEAERQTFVFKVPELEAAKDQLDQARLSLIAMR